MRLFVIGASLGFAVSAFSQDPANDNLPSPKAAMSAFLGETKGPWVTQWHPATGTPSAIYGTGLPLADWRENSLAEARRHANALLRERAALLGLGTSEFRENIGARMGRTWSFKFDQYFHNLPVIHGRADVRINMIGVVAMLGSCAWPIPADFDVVPTISEETAVAIAWHNLGTTPKASHQATNPKPTRLVIWGDSTATELAPFYLAWEVPVSNIVDGGVGPIGRYYIDAKTGEVRHYQNDKHECGLVGCTGAHAARTVGNAPPVATTVTVLGWTRTGDDAFSALVNTPLRGIVLNVPGIGAVTTDANGQFVIDIAAPVNIAVGALDGTHHAAILGVNPPAGNFVVNPGVPATIQILTAAATTNEAAHTTCSYFVDKINEYCRAILGNTPELAGASAITPTVNQAGSCNAYYTGNTIHFYPAGGGCSNTAFSSVVVHEWGHGLDDRYGGISNLSNDGLSEGWGDIFGLYLLDSPILGSGFQTAGVGIRNGMNTKMYGTQTEVHAAGEIWMGFAWRYRENLRAAFGTPMALQISEDTVIASIVADATNQADAVVQVFIADDDDGNLANGVPHYAQLSAAAIAKGMPYPQIQVASIAHTPLTNTTTRLTPRLVSCTAAAVSSGSITQVRLHYNAGTGAQIRNMHPSGVADGYRAMLPGQLSGSVTYHIEAVHSGGTTVRLPATGEYSYTTTVPTSGPFVGFHLQNFDAGAPGWTTGLLTGITNDWQLGIPNGKAGTVSGVAWSDPSAAASTGQVYGTDLGAGTSNGRYPNSVSYYLRSPAINCTGQFGCFLRFKRWLTVEEGIYDQARILVNGIEVWANPLSGHLVDTSWQTVEYPIPMADNNAAVTVEFRLTADAGLNLGGWNIDNFELGTKLIVPLDAELRMLPEQVVQGAAMNVTIATPSSSRPFLIGLGDTSGPTIIPGIPVLLVGGNLDIVGGSTDAAGNAAFAITAPSVPSATGLVFYSQVLTLDAALSQFVVSNQHLNLITQTP